MADRSLMGDRDPRDVSQPTRLDRVNWGDKFSYVREMYDVPARKGRRVEVDGKPGVIAGADGQYLRIRFDGETGLVNVHPCWRVLYEMGDGEPW